METSLVLILLLFAALATGGSMVNWIVLGLAMLRTSVSAYAQGALPTLFAATEPTAQAGGFYGPDGFLETKGYPAPAKIPARAQDSSVAQQLWKESERLTGVSFPIASDAGSP